MISPGTFRSRIFWVLLFVAVVPTALTLAFGTLVLREVVVATGTAGAWDQVAESGRVLLDAVEVQEDASPELVSAAQQHRLELAESVRLSRLFAFLGDRILVLLPLFALVLLGFVGAVTLLAANRFARSFSRPVEDLVAWTRSLGAGKPLPPPNTERERGELREFIALRQALRQASEALVEARRREIERVRMESWSDMARRVAHDLRNPLTPMRMAAGRVSRADDPALAEAGRVLEEEIRRLDAMALTFAQFGRPPEGPMAAVDVAELLQSIARRLSTGDVGLRLQVPDEPVQVTGHLEALERVVRNLIANAQEATMLQQEPEAEPAPVEVSLLPLRTGVEIRFLDRGPGIPDDILPRIWEPEFTTKRRGTGLGLPMVRQVVRAHGGEVWAFNRDGGGAEFRIQLPYAPPDREDSEGEGEGEPRGPELEGATR